MTWNRAVRPPRPGDDRFTCRCPRPTRRSRQARRAALTCVARAQLPEKAGGDAIVNVSSVFADRGLPMRAAYSASEHGIRGITRSSTLDWAAREVVGAHLFGATLIFRQYGNALLGFTATRAGRRSSFALTVAIRYRRAARSDLAGSLVGGLTSGATTWLSHQHQAKSGNRLHNLTQRENRYRAFVVAASETYGSSMVNNEPRIQEVSNSLVVECAEQTVNSISDT